MRHARTSLLVVLALVCLPSAPVRRLESPGPRRARHGRLDRGQRQPGRPRHAAAGRERHRRGGRRRLRAGGDAPVGRQHRRRRTDGDPLRRRADDVDRLPRGRARQGASRHVPRCRRQRHPRAQPGRARSRPASPARWPVSRTCTGSTGSCRGRTSSRPRSRSPRTASSSTDAMARLAARGADAAVALPRVEPHLPQGTAPSTRAGERFVQPDLADDAARHRRPRAPTASTRVRSPT